MLDYLQSGAEAEIQIQTSVSGAEKLPASYFFRSCEHMPQLEQSALSHCRGQTLDVGAGAGAHSLALQEMGRSVTALERSALAVEAMRIRGIRQIVQADFFQYNQATYDTLLLLMNGIGLVGQLSQLPTFFSHVRRLLNPDGQLILDSSDLIDLYQDDSGAIDLRDCRGHYGEVDYVVRYADHASHFSWLFVDPETLAGSAHAAGFAFELLEEGSQNDYLARITFK